jgi:hypothetical protein
LPAERQKLLDRGGSGRSVAQSSGSYAVAPERKAVLTGSAKVRARGRPAVARMTRVVVGLALIVAVVVTRLVWIPCDWGDATDRRRARPALGHGLPPTT